MDKFVRLEYTSSISTTDIIKRIKYHIDEKYNEKSVESKKEFFLKYLRQNNDKKHQINDFLIEYFNKYEAFCFDLSADSVLRGDLIFNYK